ncbi:beta transducin [Didymosphaeria variabile]|uniref:Beta transducin n=1 Tax=Didymosphaeria variabile TaxID=1932322 RepID=A0A9W8X9X1_9PLEO|nr:beta transducin [Didymosphaeria variabile]KAJ4345395.1 beta transducin [Didymosphaeria variabile]
MTNDSASAEQPTAVPSTPTARAGGSRVAKTYPRVIFLPNGLLDVDRKRGKFFKMLIEDRAQENQEVSPFLQLPPEIRSTIYEYTLGDETFKISPQEHILGKTERKKKEYLALLLVSRQVYVETALIPFKMNAFQADNPRPLKAWVGLLPIAAQQSITRIHLSTRLYWHSYVQHTEQLEPLSERLFPVWWSQSGNFDNFPALRQVCILTTVGRCYCDKPKPLTDALTKLVGDSEDACSQLIKASHRGIAGKSIDVNFQRDLVFAPL